MTEFFLNVVNMSISASWIVLAVLMLRILLKKAPKWMNVLLWGIVALRLICPFSFESVLSLIPSSQTINPETALNSPVIDSGVTIIDNIINPIIGEATISVQPEKDINLFQFIMPYLAGIWLVGIAALLIYTLISFLRLKSKIGTAVLLRDNIYQSEAVFSPFVLGIIKPKIYLPFNMNGQDMDYVISHERAHVRRKDHLWKPLGFLILTLHWFNPMVWLGYILLCRDIELACDEKVVKEFNVEQKADYSQALLTCSVNRRMIAACPLAFGEADVKGRVKAVLNYKKPAFRVIMVSILASTVAALCFLTNPASDRLANIEGSELDAFLTERTAVMESDGETHRFVGAVNDDVIKKLFDIKISRKEVSLSRDEERDKTNTLILKIVTEEQEILTSFVGGIYVHFNADFSEVWVNDGVKPTFSYEVKDPKKAKDIYEVISGTRENIENQQGSSDLEGVSLRITSFNHGSADSFMDIEWINGTSEQLSFGEQFAVYYNENGKWVNCSIIEDPVWHLIGYVLYPESTVNKTYNLSGQQMNRNGKYRFEANFSIDGQPKTKYKVWVEFEVKANNGSHTSLLTEKYDLIPMVMIDGELYLDTGYKKYDERSHSDGIITSQVKSTEKPAENNQSNFGTGHPYRFGETEGTVEIGVDSKWLIFATEEVRQELQFGNKYNVESNSAYADASEPDSSVTIQTMTCIINEINANHFVVEKIIDNEKSGILYQFNYDSEQFNTGDKIVVEFKYPIENSIPYGLSDVNIYKL